MSRTLFDGLNKQTEYESKLAICEHAGESTVPKELTSFSAPPLSIRGRTFTQNSNFANQYHLSIKTHVECVALIEKKALN